MASITAKINTSTSSGAQKKVSVTLPSGSSLQNSSLSLKLLGDVDVTNLNDGALLQYRASDGKFVSRNEIVTTTGTLTFNGGTFRVIYGNGNTDKKKFVNFSTSNT